MRERAKTYSECFQIGTEIRDLVERLSSCPNVAKIALTVYFIESILRTCPNPEEAWSVIRETVQPKGVLPLLLRRRLKATAT